MSTAGQLAALTPPGLDQERVLRAATRLEESWGAELPPLPDVVARFIDGGQAFAHLLAVSPISLEKLLRDRAALEWLSAPEIHSGPRGPRRMLADYDALRTPEFDAAFRPLRQVKARQMLRIALREVGGLASVEETTLELTTLAELCLRVVCDGWFTDFVRRFGRPETEFAVLGMGKFGGQELNHSSDIDVIFFYGDEGRLNPRFTHQEFFARFVEKIIATFSASNPAGSLFRIDLRLRPEGGSGPLVRSLESMENYYAGFGETWERMALVKARLVAGSEEFGYEFNQRLQPFVFPRTISPDVLEEIRAIKVRIEREIVGQEKLRRNVKLGHGGIREIEFVVQTLQILHAARHAFLQERSTLKALRGLSQLEFLPAAEVAALSEAYRFLRTVEHRLQIEHEAQTHTLPEDREALRRLAASLQASRALTQGEPLERFQAELHRHTEAVRTIFDRVLGGAGSRTRAAPIVEPVDLSFFRDPATAERVLAELEAGPSSVLVAPRTRRLYARLQPQLLAQLQRVADPDVALTRFVRFVERYGLRGLLFETLLRSPRVLELLVRLFDASHFMTEIVLKRPQLIEEVARGQGLGDALRVEDYLRGLAEVHEGLAWPEWVRAYRRAQGLRIGLRDLLGFATLRDVQAEYTALAEACVIYVQRQLGLEDRLTIVAMGKFGGRELAYGADLDVIFIGDDSKAAGELQRAMKSSTDEGAIFPMDARLRPEGEAGPLAASLESCAAYYAGPRAQLWEAQALTKARPISGPQQAEALAVLQQAWRAFGRQAELFPTIAAMHERVARERGGGELDFKTGRGGVMHVEFFTQAHQMRAGVWEQNTVAALELLAAQEVIAQETAERLREAYLFLRRVEMVLRRVEERGVSRLPAEETAQHQLARRCGFASRDRFLRACEHAREEITELARFEAP